MAKWSAKPDAKTYRLEIIGTVDDVRVYDWWVCFVASLQDFMAEEDFAELHLLMLESQLD